MKRLKANGGAYYHLVNRCALQHYLFSDEDKRVFIAMMRRVAAFCGLDILTHCVMSNHYHILIHVPVPKSLSEKELLSRIGILYGAAREKEMRLRWDAYRKENLVQVLEKEQNHLRQRMFDISPFMKSLNQRFSVWYRAHHKGHSGTLWESRFGSTLVEGNGSLAAVAAYIDLNPIRAGLVKAPEDYAYSGYGAAMNGDSEALSGLFGVYGDASRGANPDKVMAAYRSLLYSEGATDLDPETVKQVMAGRKTMPLPQLLRCKIRAMTKGMAIGSKTFTDAIFKNHREAFSENRRHPPLGGSLCPEWDGIQLCSVRRLRKNSVIFTA